VDSNPGVYRSKEGPLGDRKNNEKQGGLMVQVTPKKKDYWVISKSTNQG